MTEFVKYEQEILRLKDEVRELKAENKRLNDKYDFQLLVKQLKEAREVAEKYADGYIFDEADEDTEQLDLNKSWRHTSGKLARAYLLKYPSESQNG